MRAKITDLSVQIQNFITSCEASFSFVLSQTQGAEWSTRARDERPEISLSDAVTFSFRFSKGLTGWLGISLTTSDANRLADGFVGDDNGTSEPWHDGKKDAFSELLRQVAGLLATRLAVKHGEVAMALGEHHDTSNNKLQICIVAVNQNGAEIPIYLDISSELRASIEGLTTSARPTVSIKESPSDNLELLMGVELKATLRFGQRQMFLRELLNLTAGSIVELDRQVQEPVELLVDGTIIAIGEVVVLDGNYGMRITSVASPRSRFEFLA